MKKYCPMAAHGEMIAAVMRGENYQEENIFCDEERCAWWCAGRKRCVLPTLVDVLDEIRYKFAYPSKEA